MKIKTTLKSVEDVKKLFKHPMLHAPESNLGSIDDPFGTLKDDIKNSPDENFLSELYDDLEPGMMTWDFEEGDPFFRWLTRSGHYLIVYPSGYGINRAIWAEILPNEGISSFWAPLVLRILTEGFASEYENGHS